MKEDETMTPPILSKARVTDRKKKKMALTGIAHTSFVQKKKKSFVCFEILQC